MSVIVSSDVCHGVGGAVAGMLDADAPDGFGQRAAIDAFRSGFYNDARQELGPFSRPWAPFVRCAPTRIV